eukprot:CAMPEP_0196783836 /NCGR_PEP_ID=MMETSP1104-20130614/15145_1 /TAXON_ID=33652 /ORGANISM="Cafeteria sp., Strain Caron Lab Isolate" /LENGTH=65 /DNA_ID=CAMNT_0042154101 /DNA_START=9 /DNA_END=202 /DNA_ORIENTATION=+
MRASRRIATERAVAGMWRAVAMTIALTVLRAVSASRSIELAITIRSLNTPSLLAVATITACSAAA